jgi:hypothetical protein
VLAANWIAVAELQIGHLITPSDLGLRFLQRERSDVVFGQASRHGDFVVAYLGLIGHQMVRSSLACRFGVVLRHRGRRIGVVVWLIVSLWGLFVAFWRRLFGGGH